MTGPRRLVVLTGSGISAESGVATFRDKHGVWAKYDYTQVATPQGFSSNPDLVHAFYNDRRRVLPSVEPNAAHFALAELEGALEAAGGAMTLITQNVDDLHERAGSKNLLHMHGELMKATCASCGDVRAWRDDLSADLVCAACERPGAMRPYVVWFGEAPRFMDESLHAIANADLFVSIGTSGAVYPAAGFVDDARTAGAGAMELNLEPSENAHLFSNSRYGPATMVVPEWAREMIDAL